MQVSVIHELIEACLAAWITSISFNGCDQKNLPATYRWITGNIRNCIDWLLDCLSVVSCTPAAVWSCLEEVQVHETKILPYLSVHETVQTHIASFFSPEKMTTATTNSPSSQGIKWHLFQCSCCFCCSIRDRSSRLARTKAEW